MNSVRSMAMIGAALASVASCYLVSIRVAGERLAIVAVDHKMARDTADIRLLRAELRTRSRLPELQRWNTQVLALAAPRAEQMMSSPLMLASFATDRAPAALATVVRDAVKPLPGIREARFIAPVPELAADAAVPGFRKVALR